MRERERIVRTLRGERTDVLAWATRLDIWYEARRRAGTLPDRYVGWALADVYRDLRLGREKYATLVKTRLRGVDMTMEVDGGVVQRESNPTLNFPAPSDLAVSERPAETVFTFSSPAGMAHVRYRINRELALGAAAPYLTEHILSDEESLPAVMWMLEHAEIVPSFDDFESSEAQLGDDGFTIGLLPRIPFQRLLLDFLGEERAFYLRADEPRTFHRLLDLLREHNRQMLRVCLDSPSLVIEYGDNFDGNITSPRLFREYAMVELQEAADWLHAQGRLLGSHMDGDMKPLLDLTPRCGVDLVESFSPAPLSRLTFSEAWEAWRDKVIIWGAIPSPIFEPHYSEAEFLAWVRGMLELIGEGGRIILGIGDQAVSPTLIERVEMVSEMLGR